MRQALLSFAVSLRLYWGERTLELAKGCLKLCVVFHKQLNDEPSNPIEKTFPQMQWGVAGRVWSFQGLKGHLYSSCVKKVCWVRTNRALYFGALLSRGGTWQFSISASIPWVVTTVHVNSLCGLVFTVRLVILFGLKGWWPGFSLLSRHSPSHPIFWNYIAWDSGRS